METDLSTDFLERIRVETGENVSLCYQCVRCTSGCPLVEHFDLTPNQVMRAVQLGMEDMVFESRTPWMCAACQTCTTRCPQGIDIARVMDFVVSEAHNKGIKAKVPEIALFNKVFLRNVDILGRAFELGLMAEMNLRTRKPFHDVDLGFEMLKHGKLRLLPEVVRKRRKKEPLEPKDRSLDEIGYYPGCSLHGMAVEFDQSARAVLQELGLQPIEPDGWVCCGSTPAHRVDHELATRLPMESLILLEQEGLSDVALPCASCFSRFRAADREIRLNPELKELLDEEIGIPYQGNVEIHSLLNLIVERVGLETVSQHVKRPLKGLKVACYYGCLLTRPPEVTGSEDPEYPMAMDRLMTALGATPVDWDAKVSCCGASLSVTHREIVFELSQDILSNAHARGADVIAVACPLCHANLDGRQTQMDVVDRLPALYFTQLLAFAFGMEDDAAFGRNLIDPRPLLSDRGLI